MIFVVAEDEGVAFGCGVVPLDEPLSPSVPDRFSLTLRRVPLDDGSALLVDEDAAALEGSSAGDFFFAGVGEGDRSLAGCLRSRVDALRVIEAGVSVGSVLETSGLELLKTFLLELGWDLTGVTVSVAVSDVADSATLLDTRLLLVARDGSVLVDGARAMDEDASAPAPGVPGDTARGVTAGPGVGGAETSDKSESPSNASMVAMSVLQFVSCSNPERCGSVQNLLLSALSSIDCCRFDLLYCNGVTEKRRDRAGKKDERGRRKEEGGRKNTKREDGFKGPRWLVVSAPAFGCGVKSIDQINRT